MHLDRYDKAILKALQRDGRISNVQLAALVSLSESACLRRVRALEDSGLIDRYAALLNQARSGLSVDVFVHIGLHREENRELQAFEEAVRNIPEVMECYLMTGEFDYLLRVVVAVPYKRRPNCRCDKPPLPAVNHSRKTVATGTKVVSSGHLRYGVCLPRANYKEGSDGFFSGIG